MPDPENDVNLPAPSTGEEVVQDVTTENTSTQEVQDSQAGEGDNQTDVDLIDVDPAGVPWKNRAMEYMRKTEEMAQNLPQLVEQKLQEVINKQQQPQQREYTVQELEAFAQQSPEHRPWVEEQKAGLLQKHLLKQVKEEILQSKSAEQADIQRQQAEASVMKSFPQMFVKDKAGNVVGWNQNNILTQKVVQYMADPRLKNDPRGLEVASKLAYSDLIMSGEMDIQKKTTQLKKQVNQLQKNVLVEGGGKVPNDSKSPLKSATEKLARTGSARDAEVAINHVLKNLGWIKE